MPCLAGLGRPLASLAPGCNRGYPIVPDSAHGKAAGPCEIPGHAGILGELGDPDIEDGAHEAGDVERHQAYQYAPAAQATVAVSQAVVQEEVGSHGDEGGDRLRQEELHLQNREQ